MNSKNALVYGATGGIGQAVCRALSEQNVNLYLIARSQNKLQQLARELKIRSSQTFCVKTITSEEEYDKTSQWLGSIALPFHFGIHAAGFGLMKKAEKLTLKEWKEVIDVNLTSAFSFFRLFWFGRAQGNTELVFFSSASLRGDWPKNSLYGASKAGLEGFARSLQQEIRQEKGRVWLYQPGSVRTGFFDRVKSHLPEERMISPAELAEIVVANFRLPHSLYIPQIPILSD